MITWLKENIGTIIALIAVIAVIALIVKSIVKDKKQGRSTCGSNCAHCANAGMCHSHDPKKQ